MASLNVVLAFLDSWGRDMKIGATIAVGTMAHEARTRCEDIISASDHTLEELAKMGHPYATRAPANPHDPPETVHVQSGELISGLRDGDVQANSSGATARVWNEEKQLDTWIQTGTEKMIARPYMEYVRNTYKGEITQAGIDAAKRRRS